MLPVRLTLAIVIQSLPVVGVDPNIDVEEGSDGSDVDLRACIEVEGLVTL